MSIYDILSFSLSFISIIIIVVVIIIMARSLLT
jgi:hypothetical protein